MAVVKQSATQRRLKGLSLGRRIYFYARNGRLVAAKWPKHRKRNRTLAELEREDWFRQAQLVIKRSAPEQIIGVTAAVAGTPWMPRDLVTAMSAGRMFGVVTDDGNFYRSLRAMTDVSNSLDIIESRPGYILIRGEDEWIGIPFAAGTATGGFWQLFRTPTADAGTTVSTNYAWRGSLITATKNFHAGGIQGRIGAEDGYGFALAICAMDGETYNSTDVYQTPGVPSVGTETQMPMFQIDYQFEAGRRYAIMAGVLGGGATKPVRMTQDSSYLNPYFVARGRVRSATETLEPGTPLSEEATTLTAYGFGLYIDKFDWS